MKNNWLKGLLIIAAFSLMLTTASAEESHHAMEGKSSGTGDQMMKEMPSQGGQKASGMMGGGMMDMKMGGKSGGMMGGGMMDMMMGGMGSCGMMGSGMMLGYNLPEEYQKFFDDTLQLRKKLHDMKFKYFEASRNPATTLGDLKKMEKEMAEIQKTLADKMPKE
ncbi:MAG: hypothetical protein KKE17_14165 [Proteobacteria bacterium]|nr:hypothetical protein [Pseudomonadota bacterium]MBU1711145.1 hypothetical protein [Pseudomonadota bacterium]